MTRFGIDARLTHYRQGGISQYIQHLIFEMASLLDGDDLVVLHSRKDDRNLATGSQQQKLRLWTPAHHRFERIALGLELLPQRLDLLHSPDFIPPIGGRFKSVITIHDLAFLFWPEILDDASRRYYNDQVHAATRRADAVIAVSEATRQDILTRLPVEADKVTVIHEAADPRFVPASDQQKHAVRQQFDLPDDYLLFVSTIEPRKNVDGLIHAYAMLLELIPDLPPLVLAGADGWKNRDIYALPDVLGISESVHWLGQVPYDALPALYSAALGLCLPSHYEGFGLTALEAMACGTPVIVSDRGSLPEVVGKAGILVNPDDPVSIAEGIETLLMNPDLSVELATKGRERAAKFSWRRAAEETLSLYQKVVNP